MTKLGCDPRPPHRIVDLYVRAESRKAQGCYTKAEELYQHALASLERDHADSAAITWSTDAAAPQDGLRRRVRLIKLRILSAVGDLYRYQGRYGEAERLLRIVVAACENLAGTTDRQTAAALINLGVVCKYQGRYREAESHYLRALRILAPNGKDQPELWPLLYNLGGIAHAQGQYAKGEQLARQALTLAEQVHGHEHPNVAVAMSNLAANLEGLGRYDEAESLYWRSVEALKSAFGPWHRDVGMNLNNLAALAQRRDDSSLAGKLYRRSLRIKQRALGPKHADVAVTLNNLACLYLSQNVHGEAESLFRQALQIYERTFGPGHPKLVAIRKNIDRLQAARAADKSSCQRGSDRRFRQFKKWPTSGPK